MSVFYTSTLGNCKNNKRYSLICIRIFLMKLNEFIILYLT